MRTYYFTIDGQQCGPVQLDQVAKLDITPDTLTWYEGLENWIQAAEIPEISAILTDKKTMPSISRPAPPAIEEAKDTSGHTTAASNTQSGMSIQQKTEPDEECPRPRLGLAIFSAIMFPTGIAAIVKTSLIKTRWEQGRYDDARWLAQSARKFSIMSIIIGAIFIALIITYYISIILFFINAHPHSQFFS